MAVLFGLSTALWVSVAAWAVNGVGLAMVVPNTQSLVADFYDEAHRGRAFGALYFTGTEAAASTQGGLRGPRLLPVRAVHCCTGEGASVMHVCAHLG